MRPPPPDPGQMQVQPNKERGDGGWDTDEDPEQSSFNDDDDMQDENVPDEEDDFNDAFVETPPLPLQVSNKRRKVSSKNRGQKSGRVKALEHEMTQVRTQLDTILSRLLALPGQITLEKRSGKGSIPLSDCPAIDNCERRVVPGDGACLWHACAEWARGLPSQPFDPKMGHDYRELCLLR